MRKLWLLLALASPLGAQVKPDTVVITVLGRVREASVTCPSFGFVGDTLSCRVWATDSAGLRTIAAFTVTSTAPSIVTPLGIVNDTTLRLHLRARGGAAIIVTAQPVAPSVGGALYFEGLRQRFVAGFDFDWTTGVTDSMALCGYVIAHPDTLAKSRSGCPGDAPVVPFTWAWEEIPPRMGLR